MYQRHVKFNIEYEMTSMRCIVKNLDHAKISLVCGSMEDNIPQYYDIIQKHQHCPQYVRMNNHMQFHHGLCDHMCVCFRIARTAQVDTHLLHNKQRSLRDVRMCLHLLRASISLITCVPQHRIIVSLNLDSDFDHRCTLANTFKSLAS